MDREKDPIYELDGKISFEKAIPFGLQHVLAMFVANIAPILIVAGAVKLSTEETGALVQAAMIIAGIGSLFQLYPLGPSVRRTSHHHGNQFHFCLYLLRHWC